MPKTKFSGNKPDRKSTLIRDTFMNSIYQTSGGHRHDGIDEDGHASKILPSRDIDARKGAPLEGFVLTVQNDNTCDWETLPEQVTNPVYPQIETVDRTLRTGVSYNGTTLYVNDGIFTLLGNTRYNINPTYQTSFALSASKTYHLRFTRYGYRNNVTWKSIAPSGVAANTFYLADLADTTATGYNRYNIDEYHAYFDSTYDDMLVARVVTNSSANVSDVVFYINQATGFFKEIGFTHAALGQSGEHYYPPYEFNKIARSFTAHVTLWGKLHAFGADFLEVYLRYRYPNNALLDISHINLESTSELVVRGDTWELYHRSNQTNSSSSRIVQVGRGSKFDVYAKAYGTRPGQAYTIKHGAVTVNEIDCKLPYISPHILYEQLFNGTYGFIPNNPLLAIS